MKLLKNLLASFVFVAGFSLGTTSAKAGCSVHLGDFDWDSANVHTAIASFVFDKGYGCDPAGVSPERGIPCLATNDVVDWIPMCLSGIPRAPHPSELFAVGRTIRRSFSPNNIPINPG